MIVNTKGVISWGGGGVGPISSYYPCIAWTGWEDHEMSQFEYLIA
jgi:hypothetical protein